MRVQVQVTTEELLAKVGRLVVELEATQVVLDRCVAVMGPEQRAQAGIASQGPAASGPAGPVPNGAPAGPALSAYEVVAAGAEDEA